MMIALNVRNKLKLVNGEFEEPTLNSLIRSLWERANDMLNEHYSQLDGHRLYQVLNDIVNLEQWNTTIELYYHKLKGLWDELDALEAPYACVCPCDCQNGRTNREKGSKEKVNIVFDGVR
ncbi:cysteine-rich receptor-like protein kinase 8 [Tanacetum coccineum]